MALFCQNTSVALFCKIDDLSPSVPYPFGSDRNCNTVSLHSKMGSLTSAK